MKFTKKKLKIFLDIMCDNYHIVNFKKGTGNDFNADIKCKWKASKGSAPRNCEHFMDYFSLVTCTGWLSRSTRSTQMFEYTKTYTCQYSFRGKFVKPFGCGAFIDFTFMDVDRNTIIRKDDNSKDSLDVTINIHYVHSHENECDNKAIKLTKCREDTESQFFYYFNEGFTPAMAKIYHSFTINVPNSSFRVGSAKHPKKNSNPVMNPTERIIKHTYDVWKPDRIEIQTDCNGILKTHLGTLEKAGVQVITKEYPFVAVLVTPAMKRLFLSGSADDYVFVESSGSCDGTDTKVTFVLAAHAAGAVPIACGLHTTDTITAITTLLETIKECLEKDTNKVFAPANIIIDEGETKREAVKFVYPNSAVWLSRFHVSELFWGWLCHSKRGANKSRHEIMKSFLHLLYAETEEEACSVYQELTSRGQHKRVIGYVQSVWDTRDKWALYDTTSRTRLNREVEASVRVFRYVLSECKIFNNWAFILFVTDKLETYLRHRLFSFAVSGKSDHIIYHPFLKREEQCFNSVKMADHQFKVSVTENPDFNFTVHSDIVYCDCVGGKNGIFCAHLCHVGLKFNVIFTMAPTITEVERQQLIEIALGNQSICFKPINQSIQCVTECKPIVTNVKTEPEAEHSVSPHSNNDNVILMPPTTQIERPELTEMALGNQNVTECKPVVINVKTEPEAEHSVSAHCGNAKETGDTLITFTITHKEQEEYIEVIEEIKSRLSQITQLMALRYTPQKMFIMRNFLQSLCNIQTAEQAVEFAATKMIQFQRICVKPSGECFTNTKHSSSLRHADITENGDNSDEPCTVRPRPHTVRRQVTKTKRKRAARGVPAEWGGGRPEDSEEMCGHDVEEERPRGDDHDRPSAVQTGGEIMDVIGENVGSEEEDNTFEQNVKIKEEMLEIGQEEILSSSPVAFLPTFTPSNGEAIISSNGEVITPSNSETIIPSSKELTKPRSKKRRAHSSMLPTALSSSQSESHQQTGHSDKKVMIYTPIKKEVQSKEIPDESTSNCGFRFIKIAPRPDPLRGDADFSTTMYTHKKLRIVNYVESNGQ